jgi:transcriptional regulator with XRE-family HTH domain
MTRSAPGDFDRLLDDIETEAAAAGPAAVRDLRALQLKYRLVNQLIERRRMLHWSQKELAEHSGIAQSEISKIERGRKSPTIDTYSRLATAMRLDGLMVPSVDTESAAGARAIPDRPRSSAAGWPALRRRGGRSRSHPGCRQGG